MIADGLIPVRSLDIHCSANFVKNILAGFRSPSPDGDQIVFHVTDEQEDFVRVDVPRLKTALYFIFQNLHQIQNVFYTY